MTIYRRGINWKRLPRSKAFIAWTKDCCAVVWRGHKYVLPYSDYESWDAREILAWADIPKIKKWKPSRDPYHNRFDFKR